MEALVNKEKRRNSHPQRSWYIIPIELDDSFTIQSENTRTIRLIDNSIESTTVCRRSLCYLHESEDKNDYEKNTVGTCRYDSIDWDFLGGYAGVTANIHENMKIRMWIIE